MVKVKDQVPEMTPEKPPLELKQKESIKKMNKKESSTTVLIPIGL